MTRLSQSSYRKLLECVGEVYAHHDLDGFARHVMRVGRKVVPADFVVYDEINLRRRRHTWLAEPVEVDLSAQREVHEYLFTEHPFVTHMRRTGDVPALRISDFLSRRKYRETGLYREAYRAFGVEYQLGFTLPSPSPGLSVGLAFCRRLRDFTEEDRLVFDLLRPHLFRAYRNAEATGLLRAESAQAKRALDASPQGLITLSPQGAVRFCSARARQWLEEYFDGARGRNGHLPDELRRWVSSQRLPSGAQGNLPAPREPLIVERAGRRLVVRWLPDSEPGGQVLLLEERRTEFSAAPLQQLGLTARQAEVLLWIAQGKTTPEIGGIMGLSSGTVRKHSEHIFEQLGVVTRTAAALRAFEILRAPAGEEHNATGY